MRREQTEEGVSTAKERQWSGTKLPSLQAVRERKNQFTATGGACNVSPRGGGKGRGTVCHKLATREEEKSLLISGRSRGMMVRPC